MYENHTNGKTALLMLLTVSISRERQIHNNQTRSLMTKRNSLIASQTSVACQCPPVFRQVHKSRDMNGILSPPPSHPSPVDKNKRALIWNTHRPQRSGSYIHSFWHSEESTISYHLFNRRNMVIFLIIAPSPIHIFQTNTVSRPKIHR